jgi:peptide/nickel transport system substrate-binding protein
MRLYPIVTAALLAMSGAASADDLRIGFADSVSSLDPQMNNYAGDHSVAQHFWSGLTQMRGIKLTPGLASSWRNIDPLTWEFTIRDAKWSDGKPVEAGDAVFSYQRALNVPGSVASFSGFLRNVDTATAKDAKTLVIKTKIPDPDLPLNLSSVYIISRHVGEKPATEDYNHGKAMVVSGPYLWEGYVPGDRVLMKRNPDFWGDKAHWEKVNYRYIANGAARTAALLAADVDVIDKVSVADIAKLKAASDVSVFAYPGLRVLLLQPSFNPKPSPYITSADGKPLDKNPLLDVKVRQALSLAINREAIVTRIMQDGATVANQWMPKETFGYNPDVKDIAFDPNQAKKLLADAGYPDGFNLTMHVPSDRYPLAPETAQVVAQFWTRVGVKTQIEVLPFAMYAGKANKNEFAMSMIAWGNGTGEAAYAMVNILATVNPEKGFGASNWGRYASSAMEQTLKEASSEFDSAKREAILRKGVKVVSDDVGIIPLFHYKNIWAARKGLKVTPWTSDRTVAMQVSPAAN